MNNKAINDIPAYQEIDIVLAGDKITKLAPPVVGYVVTFPDNKLDAVLLTNTQATPEKLLELKAMSKWPDQIYYRKAWLHSEQIVYGQIQKRNHWSLR